jgi:G:T-mismatch repair DNA endonuclease (very short patch repair protein)
MVKGTFILAFLCSRAHMIISGKVKYGELVGQRSVKKIRSPKKDFNFPHLCIWHVKSCQKQPIVTSSTDNWFINAIKLR